MTPAEWRLVRISGAFALFILVVILVLIFVAGIVTMVWEFMGWHP